jgi:ABC-2 type transport system ATP-binding protein
MNDCLSMCGVCKSYDAGVRGCSATVSVLRDIHLDVVAGEIVAISAAPASGKTTLLMCAGGLMRPDRGRIAWFGAPSRGDVASRPEGIAFAGDRPFPYGFLTIREALEYASIVRDLPIHDNVTRVGDALDRVMLSAISHRRVDSLDGNSRARLSVASALLAHPRLVLIDDFAPGCDLDTAAELMAVLGGVVCGGAALVIAGRYVSRLSAAGLLSSTVRRYTLANARLESLTDETDVAVRVPLAPPSAYTRVAEGSPGSAASENGGR